MTHSPQLESKGSVFSYNSLRKFANNWELLAESAFVRNFYVSFFIQSPQNTVPGPRDHMVQICLYDGIVHYFLSESFREEEI